MSIIDDVFTPLYGKPCWSVHLGLGTSLEFNFGDPHIEIREPINPKNSYTAKVRRYLSRREVQVQGSWRLWISFCGWRFYNHEREIGTSIASKRAVNRVIELVDGQALIKVIVEETGVTTFQFDLGGLLETYPVIDPDDIPETMDCWTLFEPSGKAFTLTKDVKYLYKSSKALSRDSDYLPLYPKITQQYNQLSE